MPYVQPGTVSYGRGPTVSTRRTDLADRAGDVCTAFEQGAEARGGNYVAGGGRAPPQQLHELLLRQVRCEVPGVVEVRGAR